MEVHVSGLKGWIEDLTVKNKSLVKEIEVLRTTSTKSLKLMEQENTELKQKIVSLKLSEQNDQLKQRIDSLELLKQHKNQLKQQIESLKLLEQENIQLKQQNESLKSLEGESIQLKEEIELLKLKIIELTKGPEIVDISSDSDNSEEDMEQKVSDSHPRPPNAEKNHKCTAKAPFPPPKKKKLEKTEWTLERDRKIIVRVFKGTVYVDIREYYMDGHGEMRPGKKGICLTVGQWRELKEVIPQVDAAIKRF